MFPFSGRPGGPPFSHDHVFAGRPAFGHHPGHGHGHGPGPGRRHGVRRPMRFLIEHLDLDDAQAAELARALESLRLEREQADLDRRRATSKVADLVEGDVLDRAALEAAAEARVAAARRERDTLVEAVTRLHAVLRPEQRRQLSTLLRGPLEL